MKIAVAGNQWITEFLLKALIEGGYTPDLIINVAEDKSGDISGYCNLEGFARKHDIQIYRPDKYSLKSPNDEENFPDQIDLLLVFGWQRLIPEWLINRCRLGVFGVHGGPLKPPRCRGRAVFNWALILGYSKFYMYLFRITPGVDEGDILKITQFDISPHDDILSLYHKNCMASSRMFLECLPSILKNKGKYVKQSDETPSYLPKRKPENGGIFWDETAERITNLIRGVAPPYPGAFTKLNGMQVQIYRAHIFDTKLKYLFSLPGEILVVFPNGDFVVGTADFPLYVRDFNCSNDKMIVKGAKFDLHNGVKIPDPVL